MTETVVHVTTLSQWRNVLDILFKQGYSWNSGSKEYKDIFFKDDDARYLRTWPDYTITYSSVPTYTTTAKLMEHYEFVVQQKEDNMTTIYVTKEQFNLIEELKSKTFPIDFLILSSDGYFKPLTIKLTSDEAKSLLRYLGGDELIEFKVKEQLYRLWRIDDDGDKVYMKFNCGTPTYAGREDLAFTAPLEEIKNWQTPAWEIEEVK